MKSQSLYAIVFGLSSFIALLSFKPSEPYLSQYLICNENSASETCSGQNVIENCLKENVICEWSSINQLCAIVPCSNVSYADCGNSDYFYCEKSNGACEKTKCYESFSESQVNNEIYPWSTYAYLPFLLLLGPFAELYSYRVAILLGILGRVITRVTLLYGNTLLEMQLMQVAYSLGTAAEDVFSAYVYYIISIENYQFATSTIKAAALVSCVVSGVLGDILVVEAKVALTVLMWISAGFVWGGFIVGLFVIRRPNEDNGGSSNTSAHKPLIEFEKVEDSSEQFSTTHPIKSLSKYQIFYQQLQCLYITLQSSTVLAMLSMWVIGNAVFQTLYDYEVSIYQELQGQNSNWNGSVLAAMLIAGSIGAMIPAMEVDPITWTLRTMMHTIYAYRPQHNEIINLDIIDRNKHEELVMTSRIMIALLCGGCALVGFVLEWEVIRSVTFLALFFATWQYINVIIFAKFAAYLKQTEMKHSALSSYQFVHVFHGDDDPHQESQPQIKNEQVGVDPPYSFAVVMIIAMNVIIQIAMQSIFFSTLAMPLQTACAQMTWIFVATTIAYILFTLWKYGIEEYLKLWAQWWLTI